MSGDLNFNKIILSGTIAIITTTGSAPIERIKLLLQNQREIIKQGTIVEPYKNSIDCLVRLYKQEGIKSFWRGNTTKCIFSFLSNSIRLSLQHKIKEAFKVGKGDSYLIIFGKNMIIGVAASAISLCLIYSLDFAYTRLATDNEMNNQHLFVNITDVYKKIYATDGIFGLYRGFGINIVDIVLFRSITLGLFGICSLKLLKPDSSSAKKVFLSVAIGFVSGIIVVIFDMNY
jgi:solute carrier family 25 (mitochondrial adenine nucleotide translocator), member 4/5/6/31